MPQSDAELEMIEALYRATASPHGTVVQVTDATQAIALAYRVRSGLADPSLAGLRFARSPTATNELWLVRDDQGARVTPSNEESSTA